MKLTIYHSAVLAGSLFKLFNGNIFAQESIEIGDFWPLRLDYQTIFFKSSGHESMCLLVYMSNPKDPTNPLFDFKKSHYEGLPAGCLASFPAAVTGATSLPSLDAAHIAKGSAGLVGSSCAKM